ncbi:MAG: dTMP kinase [Parachlamydiaceae bacterium]
MTQKIKAPLFISFEGGEGAGKTSLMNALSAYFYDKGCSTVVTREPGGTRLSEDIRRMVLHPVYDKPIEAKAELLLFLAARAQHVKEVILPSLQDNKIVLCDRFHDSTVAYQGFAQQLGEDEVYRLTLFAAEGLKPDLTIYLDIDPEIGLRRAQLVTKEFDGKVDRIEAKKIEFHQKVRESFLRIAAKEPHRFKMIKGYLPKEEVLKQAIQLIEHV